MLGKAIPCWESPILCEERQFCVRRRNSVLGMTILCVRRFQFCVRRRNSVLGVFNSVLGNLNSVVGDSNFVLGKAILC